ncbi:MAG: Hpt domain-containing protein [Beijerinckiaceae bacterium]|nr:Hpt domain-containing protein [Beijerinckiaceae bacterium]
MTTNSASFERPIDLVHLARQTLGDRELEREILALFVRQSILLRDRILKSGVLAERRDLVHTLKGSARAVGAWSVAKAAENVETALMADDASSAMGDAALSREIAELARTIHEANDVIIGLGRVS